MLGWHDLSGKQPHCQLDQAFYDRVRAGRPTNRLVEAFVVPPYSGRGFRVQKGQTFRIIEETGPQVAAIAVWNADETRESIFPAGTWSQEGIYLRRYGRLLSTPPWRRPLMTCIEDTVRTNPPETAYHHHFLGTHCSPEFMEMRFGVAGLNGCRANLVRAIAPLGLKETDLHDSINLYQKAYLDMKRGKIWVVPSDAKAGDHVEFFAEAQFARRGVRVPSWRRDAKPSTE